MQANRLVMQGASKAATTTVRAAAAVRVSQPTTIDVQAQPKPAVVFEPTHELQKIPTSVSALQETPLVENTAMNTCVTLAREPEIEWVAHKKVLPDLKHILSDCPDFGSLLTVQTWQTTEHSMVSWKRAVEKEREQKTAKWAALVCATLKDEGFWADFIDPTSGLAFFAKHNTNRLFVATDVGIHRLGYSVLDTGCCKVLVHPKLGAKAFPATLFTTAPEEVLAKCINSVEMSQQ